MAELSNYESRWLALYLVDAGIKIHTAAMVCELEPLEIETLLEDRTAELNRIENEYNTKEKHRVQEQVQEMLADIPEEEKRSVRINLILERLKKAKKENDRILYQKLKTQYQILKGIEVGINPQDILAAREYPITSLVKSVRGMAVCPFHTDKTPSMDTRKNFYHCYGCGAQGDTIDLVMKLEGLTFKQAVARLT